MKSIVTTLTPCYAQVNRRAAKCRIAYETEHWSDGVLEYFVSKPITPLLQYSTIREAHNRDELCEVL
jgi:hypothetical protein